MTTLPILVEKKNRYIMGAIGGMLLYVGYAIPNHFHLLVPQLLPLTEIDRAVPLISWTVLIYISEYLFFCTAYILYRQDLNRNRFLWSLSGILVLAVVIFVFFPTTYPRADYPIPPDTSPFIHRVFSGLRVLDDPSNSFPSLHVACCYLTAFWYLTEGESRLSFWAAFLWSTAIAISTLTTKQHYLVDVVAGILLSIGGFVFFSKKVRYIPMAEYLALREQSRTVAGGPSAR